MKPTNKPERGCDPVSSNCVVWQGPDIECIDLCKGDTVSDVVAKLATELCTIMDIVNIDSYDISCFGLQECAPQDFVGLVQLLINRVCEQNNIEPPINEDGSININPTPPVAPSPFGDQIAINPKFYYKNPQGDTMTTMTVLEYVTAIGNKIGTIIGQIQTIDSITTDHENRLADLEANAGSSLPLKNTWVPPRCIIDTADETDEKDIVSALAEQFCTLRTAVGTPDSIAKAMQAACKGLNNEDRLGSGYGKMKDIEGWYETPVNLSQSFSNLWKALCDTRNAVRYIKSNCCNTGCESIELQVKGEMINPNTLVLTFGGSIPNNFADAIAGSTIILTDDAGSGPQTINGVAILSSHIIPNQDLTITLTGVNGAVNVNVQIIYKFTDAAMGTSCEGILNMTVLGTDTCPVLTLVPSYTSLDWSFAWNGTTPQIMLLEVWDVATDTLIQSISTTVTTSSPSGIISNLEEGTNYKVRLIIGGVPCGFQTFTTLEYPCIAPTMVEPDIDYSNPEGDVTGANYTAWQVEYDSYHT